MLGFESECAFIGYPSQTKPRGLNNIFILNFVHFYNTYKCMFSGYFCIFFCKGNSYFSTSGGTKFRIVQKKAPNLFRNRVQKYCFFLIYL